MFRPTVSDFRLLPPILVSPEDTLPEPLAQLGSWNESDELCEASGPILLQVELESCESVYLVDRKYVARFPMIESKSVPHLWASETYVHSSLPH